MASSQTLYQINKRPIDDASDDEERNVCKVCNAVKDEEKIKWLLKCININELFRDLNSTQKRHIVLAMKLIEIKQNAIVLKQHSVIPQTVYIVEDGEFFAIIDGMRVRSWIREGIFGELALLYDSPRAATIECVSNIGHLWELDRTTFENIVNQYANTIQNDDDDDDDDDEEEENKDNDEFVDLMISPMIQLKKRASIGIIKKQIQLKNRAIQQNKNSIDDEIKQLFDIQQQQKSLNDKDAMNCIQFKRIAYILSKYQNNQMGDSKYEYLNVKLGEYNYCTSKLYDDFYYVVNIYNNDYEFEILYNILICQYFKDIECNINDCIMFKRNMRDRSKYDENIQKYYNQDMDIKEVMTIQLLDKIHCYFVHSYHQNHRLRNNEIIINNNNNNNMLEMTNLIRGRRENLKLNRIHHNKYNMAEMDKYNVEEEKKNDNNDSDMVYSFGMECWYWNEDKIHDEKENNEKQLIIPQKYKSLKEELLNNDIHTIQNNQWDILFEAAANLIKMNHVITTYKADWNNRGIKRGEIISKSHLICLMVYSNYDLLQRRFTETYRKLNVDETNDSMILRHCNFYNLGKLLYEAINIYGKSIKDYDCKQFYHGISNEMVFASPKARIYGPLSTTIAIAVADCLCVIIVVHCRLCY